MHDPNRLLRAARERTPSRRIPGAYMSREELAEAVALWATEHDSKHRGVAFDANHLGKLERGTVRRPRQVYVNALCAVLNATPAELGFDVVAVATRPLRTVPDSHSGQGTGRDVLGDPVLVLCDALSRCLGRNVTLDELGLTIQLLSSRAALDWRADSLIALTDLGKVDLDMERRRVLAAAAYSVAALALPDESWWRQMAARGTARATANAPRVGRGDLETVREMASVFSRIDQRRGGGHARTAVVQYLTSDVARYLQGSYLDEQVRKDMFSVASELAYLSGWMAFDNAEHSIADHYFCIAVKLAAEADDPAMAGHVLRAMAHQAVDLGHVRQGLELAAASMEGTRYRMACPRERALFGVVYARALGAASQSSAAAQALIAAEDDLAAATSGDDEPSRVFFFGEASLAHETACTLRDTGDLSGALTQFRRSVRTRKVTTFTRTHAVTLGYLGAVHARRGEIDQACSTWSTALDVMGGIHSARARQTVVDMRAALSAFCRCGAPAALELDARVCAYLNTGSP